MPKKPKTTAPKSMPRMGTPEVQALIHRPWSAEEMAGVLLEHVRGPDRKLPDDEKAGFFWRARKDRTSILLETSHGAFVLEVRPLPTEKSIDEKNAAAIEGAKAAGDAFRSAFGGGK